MEHVSHTKPTLCTRASTDRFPAPPVITEGYPKNVTALIGSTATFRCPLFSDLGVFVQWAKYHAYNKSDNKILRHETESEVGRARPGQLVR